MKKACIFLPLSEEIDLKKVSLPKYLNIAEFEIHLVHCHKIQTYVNELSMYSFPSENEFPIMTETTNTLLNNFGQQSKLQNFSSKCFFDFNPKDKCLDYLKENNFEFCIVLASKKNALELLFEGSFLNYMNKYAPCDVITLRA